ncbi:contactin-associated protein like 5-3 [Hydra vulgaris]|uniref:contactin-associated protein like 5-3 n=1 Tax=Hydra vulgaris TaxID=6087 RepID=UPI001F5E9BDF|nr:contactin-associated protein like 5-3 [Hydra vulgaris]
MKRIIFQLFAAFVVINFIKSDIEISSDAFRVFHQEQITTRENYIKLRFKTIEATGLIMLAQGADKERFLSMELFRGKIRIAANFGNGPLNQLRPVNGFYEMYLGIDLADNKWHTVEFIRNVRDNIIYIDRGRGKMEKYSFVLSPPTYIELPISMITFGGYYSFQASEISMQKSLSRKGIKACFNEAVFSQHLPETNGKTYDFLVMNSPNYKHIGEPAIPCADLQYSPLYFPSSAVHIAFTQNYTIQSMKISLKFRTVINEQILANYTTIDTGDMIQLIIDRKGRVGVSVGFKGNIQIIQTATENYHDGQWHNASFEIDNVPATDGTYIIKFTVDGKTRLSNLNNVFYFNGYINIGFGFTGCMRDIKINDDDIKSVRKDLKDTKHFFTYNDEGVVYNSCTLKDYCNPNPCQNGASCNQTEDNIKCDCQNTLYEGSTCHRPRFNYTCAGVKKSGEKRSDVYYIDFDGMGPMQPVLALCILGRTIESSITQINNTNYNDKDVTTASGKNNFDIDYAANIVQMRELILNSAYCEQYIKYTCLGTPIFRSPEGPPSVRWMGGDDILHYYWGGAKNNRGYCACGLDQTCFNVGKYCNCDDLSAYQSLVDDGNLTIKEHLPVRQVQFDQVLKGSVTAQLRVDHLRCTGSGAREVAATFRKPYSFLSVYFPDQPFDNIYAGGVSFEFKTSVAYNYLTLVNAYGPFSGDYLKIMIWSRTLIRVLLNFGFGEIKQDVDIEKIGRYIDDNEWHEFDLMFNMKEVNVTLDGILMIHGLPLQDDPVQLNVDGRPMYIGGSYYDEYGFVGCIRSLYINGRISNIHHIAEGQEDYGVYPGCGSACILLNKPCNYGECIDYYNAFQCNCSISPYDGKYCQNETYPMKFSGDQFISYDLLKANNSVNDSVATATFVIGFKTTEENVVLAQLSGRNGRHISLALSSGYLTLFYSFKNKITLSNGLIADTETRTLTILERKLSNNQHNVARVKFSTNEVYLSVPNYDLKVSENIIERYIDENNKNLGTAIDTFGVATSFRVGKIINNGIKADPFLLSTSFVGCMSGAKLVIHPLPSATMRFQTTVEFDLFKQIQMKPATSDSDSNPSGQFPTPTSNCGPEMPIPGELPTVGPKRQFFTLSPGLDNSIHLTKVNTRVILFIISLILIVLLFGLFYVIYIWLEKISVRYNKLKQNTKTTNPAGSFQQRSLNMFL